MGLVFGNWVLPVVNGWLDGGLAHWLKDAELHAASTIVLLDTLLTCDDCDGLAVWLNPEDLTRYCQEHAKAFGPCGICSRTMLIADMVSRSNSELAGHEHCIYADS